MTSEDPKSEMLEAPVQGTDVAYFSGVSLHLLYSYFIKNIHFLD